LKLNSHLAFDGQCQAALEFFERCFGGKIVTMLTYGNSPMAEQVPPEWRGKIVHATLTFGGNVLMGADVLQEQYEKPRGFHMLLGADDPTEAERIYHALSENGTVQMPLQKTFWAILFGVLVDQYGISWEINCEPAR
jgi:PhnB protein